MHHICYMTMNAKSQDEAVQLINQREDIILKKIGHSADWFGVGGRFSRRLLNAYPVDVPLAFADDVNVDVLPIDEYLYAAFLKEFEGNSMRKEINYGWEYVRYLDYGGQLCSPKFITYRHSRWGRKWLVLLDVHS